MYILLIAIVWGLFGAVLFLNIYFRVKVFKVYKKLVQGRVEFGAAHIFNAQKMETEILPRYPNYRTEILTFVSHLRYSMRLASVLITLITIFGAILMYYRHE
jgi:multisubunit Na+/H+ antiporter MnhB subunit